MLFRSIGGTNKKLEALAEHYYTPDPTDAELAAIGLTREDFAGESLEVLPDNEQAFLIFCSISTQWRTTGHGYTGLDYNVLFHKLDRLNLSDDEYQQLENDVGMLESAALKVLNRPAT